MNWEEILECPPASQSRSYDWDSAPVESSFYGRTSELTQLQEWLSDRCRLVILHGLGGIGKTALAVELAEQSKAQFSMLIWQQFSYFYPVEHLLIDLLNRLSPNNANQPGSRERLISRVLEELRQRRVLVVLDEQDIGIEDQSRQTRYRDEHPHYTAFTSSVSLLNVTLFSPKTDNLSVHFNSYLAPYHTRLEMNFKANSSSPLKRTTRQGIQQLVGFIRL